MSIIGVHVRQVPDCRGYFAAQQISTLNQQEKK